MLNRKICSKCGEILNAINDFYKGKATCKKCYNDMVIQVQKLKRYEKKKELDTSSANKLVKIENDLNNIVLQVSSLTQMTNRYMEPLIAIDNAKLMEIKTYCENILASRDEYVTISDAVQKSITSINENINFIKKQLNEGSDTTNNNEANLINSNTVSEVTPGATETIDTETQVTEPTVNDNDTALKKRGRPKKPSH